MMVRFTKTANRENGELLSTIAADNPSSAASVAAAIEVTILRLSAFPRLGAETDYPGVRLMVARPHAYLIFYTIENDVLIVRNIRHPSRQWPRQQS